ncbi:MAG: esterase-like activity of phytase family protein [Phycisphaeraceae bacterium]|nr:esterase-like activity of phytase family protein [Phycisphaeraceae bacterium]
MIHSIGIGLAVVHAAFAAALAVQPGVELIARCEVSAQASDLSGLDNLIGNNIPHDRFGGWGSAIAWTGQGNRYIVASDRGPGDGASAFRCRVHIVEIDLPADRPTTDRRPRTPEAAFRLVETIMLTTSDGRPFWGNTGNYNRNDQKSGLRLDPEGVGTSPSGTLWLSEEYGPWIDEFDMSGRHLRRIAPPEKFRIATPDGDPEREMPPYNTRGRQPNRGFEGLAISDDGAVLWAILQGPLIQDGAFDEERERVGRNVRVLEVRPETGAMREFVYTMNSAAAGISEVLSFEDRTLLVLERDGRAGEKARFRGVFAADFEGATDVSAIDSLPSVGLSEGVSPLRKRRIIDFMDPRHGLIGPEMPEKIEGLCFGPDLPDGRKLLIVTSDNDLKDGIPSHVWLFAIDPAVLRGR